MKNHKLIKHINIGHVLVGIGMILLIFNTGFLLKSKWETTLSYRTTSLEKYTEQKNWLSPFKMGEKIGTISIPKLHQTMEIFEGTDPSILKKGIGHYKESSYPGEKNNSILSGHRDTFFYVLKKVKEKDTLIIETTNGKFVYKIRKIEIVSSSDTTVLTPKSRSVLTLTTCYPFTFIGNAPNRYIITADLISSKKIRVN
jgi:LPXTG-site transpeptidase (sortase) family protein